MNDDGGPAFPCAPTDGVLGSFGMSLRDYFAAHIAAAYVNDIVGADKIAAWSYEVADAMLAERAKVTP